MKPFAHQLRYAKNYKDRELVVHEGGTGKTVCACLWLKDGRDRDALVICPKRVVEKWKEALKDWGSKATVVSKDQFKKMPAAHWSALVVDEADEFASPLFGKGRSKLAAALYDLIKQYDMPTLLLSATPIRSTPWNLHTLLCYLRIYIPHEKWRNYFFSLERRPYLPRPAWIPKSNWRQLIRPTLEKYSDIVLLKDCVGDLPPVTEKVLRVKVEKYVPVEDTFHEEHRNEQLHKPAEILEVAKQYRKVLVVAYYREEIATLEKILSKDRLTFTVHGGVKDQEVLLKKANEVDECFLIVQASLGAGFDADTFSVVVYTSMSYKVRDFVQMGYRVRRIKNLHPVVYYYLLAGRCDKAVYETIKKGLDFVPSHWKPIARIAESIK